MKRKSIVLSDAKFASSRKAVLSLEEDGVGVHGTLRLYNFSSELNGVSSLGFYVDKKVYKAGLTKKANMFYEFFADFKEIPQNFSCAVVNFQNAEATPILFGASEGKSDDVFADIISSLSQNSTMQNVEKVLDEHDIDFDEEEKAIVEKEIDDALCANCEECIYKKYYYENQKGKENFEQDAKGFDNFEIQSVNLQEEEIQEPAELFIDKLKPQIDKLFEKNPIEDNLQNLIPNSKWVRVEYEDDGDFYVFGLLYDDDEIRYVCYGVPAVFEETPPKELSGYPIWLPLNKENSTGFGYWLTYQDAQTGEPIKAVLE